MYKQILITKYLTRKLVPMFAAAAVTLCTAMVIIVISVMGGFLDLLREGAQRLTADVTIVDYGLRGFPHYEDLQQRLMALDSVEAATPVIHTWGLMKLEDDIGNTTVRPVHLMGIKPDSYRHVTDYEGALYWTQQRIAGQAAREDRPESLDSWKAVPWKQLGMALSVRDRRSGEIEPGAVLGIATHRWHSRDEQGRYSVRRSALGATATLAVVPMTEGGAMRDLRPVDRQFIVVNEFKSGLHEIDQDRVYVPFDDLQAMLSMDREQVWEEYDEQTGEPIGEPTTRPARASMMMVVGKVPDGAPEGTRVGPEQLSELRAQIDGVVQRFRMDHEDNVSPYIVAQTWEESHATMLAAVENEKGLVSFLFVIISVVAFVMVATTFYNIVLEKTRDIGVLRAIGASRFGVASIFLGYGLAIGLVGAILGMILASLIVTNLNGIQELIHQLTGWRMWDPRVYLFDRIPDEVSVIEAAYIMIGAVIASTLGALIPALVAARVDPVETLRYE